MKPVVCADRSDVRLLRPMVTMVFCGAESGYIPVSAVAPSVLVSEIELQRISDPKEKPPLLPPPFFDGSR